MNEVDTREKLYADIDHWLGSWTALSVPTSTIKEAILGWLGRMAGIVEHECVDTRVNFAERASFPQHHEDDSREKLEADVLRYYTHTTSTLMWPDDANIKTKWVSVSMDTVLEWLDRAADIRECDFIQQYCAECESAENAALKDDIEVLRNRLDKLQAENDELLAAHADDVERLDAMGEGELQKQVDELQAERDYWRQEVQYCMDAAYPPSHAPERPYNPHVMDYPPSGAYTTPSTLVGDLICGLRDEKVAEWVGVLKQLKETQAERDRYRELASELLDAAHNMQLIADRGLA